MNPGVSLSRTVCQSAPAPVGLTQAESVIPLLRSRSLASATVTQSVTPSNESAPPFFPAADHVAPEIVPVCPLPVASAAVVPVPASKDQAATRPDGGGGVCLPTVPVPAADVVSLPAASRATARRVWRPAVAVVVTQEVLY